MFYSLTTSLTGKVFSNGIIQESFDEENTL